MNHETNEAGKIERTHCENADEFLDELRPDNKQWWAETASSGTESPWLFRGQPLKKPLLPSAWRRGSDIWESTLRDDALKEQARNGMPASRTPLDKETLKWAFLRRVADAEVRALKEFAALASRFGFNLSDRTIYDTEASWLIEAVAPVAQHHSVPTRWLDWTEGPLEAAFFASAADWQVESDLIYVYALRRPHRYPRSRCPGQYLLAFGNINSPGGCKRIWEKRPQSSFSPYMLPQRSILIRYGKYPGPNAADEDDIEDPNLCAAESKGLDELIEEATEVPSTPMLREISVSSECAAEIELRLNRMGINRLSLMPSHDNLGREMLRRLKDI